MRDRSGRSLALRPRHDGDPERLTLELLVVVP